MTDPTLTPDLPHKGGGAYGVTHDWDCPACVSNDLDRKARYGLNPHRPGTKAAAKWDSLNSAGALATDPRSETYWSM